MCLHRASEEVSWVANRSLRVCAVRDECCGLSMALSSLSSCPMRAASKVSTALARRCLWSYSGRGNEYELVVQWCARFGYEHKQKGRKMETFSAVVYAYREMQLNWATACAAW